ncbi:MAG: 5-formyltetrahydrofolate cyclo-ligase [Clostridiales bacterium]|nr:5-formyltetrahydrofolate cyclo-ligase [Clostridiales bacterium]
MDERIQREKQRLRRSLRKVAENLPEDYIARSDLDIQKNLLTLELWTHANVVFIYVSIGQEPQTRGIIRAALDAGKTVAVPRSLADGYLEARVIASLDNVKPGRFDIPEPDETTPVLPPDDIDLVIVPCIAADKQGYRLGHGGGYYDRYLAQVHCTTVCLCRERLLKTALPRDAFDIPVDIIVTEREYFHTR